MSDASAVLDDLRSEGAELDLLVAGLSARQWAGETPAEGWTVAHQVAHLSWTDEVALLSVTEPEHFGDQVAKAMENPEGFIDQATEEVVAAYPPDALLVRWRAGREQLQTALRAASAGTRFPWYGPPMSVASMATGRLMETWAHGQDIADALGVTRVPGARLRHVARIGVRARDYAFLVRGIQAPAEEFRVELDGPGGELLAFGPEGAAQRITGPLHDFCLLVTQRAHRDDLAVRAEGAEAEAWLDIAQAFAGPAGSGRAPKRGSGE